MYETFFLRIHKFLLGFARSEEGKTQYHRAPSSKLFPADVDTATTDTYIQIPRKFVMDYVLHIIYNHLVSIILAVQMRTNL
jgi:hypothetical protein